MAPSGLRPSHRVVVVGATGFVGRAVVAALVRRGAAVTIIRAPRLAPVEPHSLQAALLAAAATVESLADEIRDHDVVINAAGRSQAGSGDLSGLLAANALLPGVIALATAKASVPRFVHFSSGAVQGDAEQLDSSPRLKPFSPYSYSKAVGEQMVLRLHPRAVVYRPAGVQGIARPASRNLVQAASSWLATTPGNGSGNSPQALVENVADAAAFLALTAQSPPPIVHHPTEGLSVGELLELLGGGAPRSIPECAARNTVRAVKRAETLSPGLAARRRRLEVMWFGQEQAASWLTTAGWTPAVGKSGWRALGDALRR